MPWGAVAGAAVSAVANHVLNHGSSGSRDAQNAGEQGAQMAAYRPVNVTSPFGATYTDNQGNLQNSMNPEMAAQRQMFTGMSSAAGNYANQAGQQLGQAGGMFSNLGQQYANNAQGAGANFTGAGNRMLSAMGNFNPQQYANQAYGNMAAMAAPGNTDQTQNMLNYEQASGRGGLTQNGQLGDLGGLALAQQTADNQMRMQAMQMGQQQQQLMGNQATQFAGMGANQTQNYGQLGSMFGNLGNVQANSAVDRYGDLSQTAGMNQGYANSQANQQLPWAQLAGQQARDVQQGGNQAAGYMVNGRNIANDIRGAQQGGLNSQLSGVYGAVGDKVGNWLGNYFNPPAQGYGDQGTPYQPGDSGVQDMGYPNTDFSNMDMGF